MGKSRGIEGFASNGSFEEISEENDDELERNWNDIQLVFPSQRYVR